MKAAPPASTNRAATSTTRTRATTVPRPASTPTTSASPRTVSLELKCCGLNIPPPHHLLPLPTASTADCSTFAIDTCPSRCYFSGSTCQNYTCQSIFNQDQCTNNTCLWNNGVCSLDPATCGNFGQMTCPTPTCNWCS